MAFSGNAPLIANPQIELNVLVLLPANLNNLVVLEGYSGWQMSSFVDTNQIFDHFAQYNLAMVDATRIRRRNYV